MDIRSVSFENGGDAIITDTLRKCTNLTSVTLHECFLHDTHMVQIVEAIRGHHALRDIQLSSNCIGLRGCQAIGTLLQGPNCQLHSLDLSGNLLTVVDTSVSIYAYAAVPFPRVEEIFITSLCNKSSINSTYYSNHILTNLKLPGGPEDPEDPSLTGLTLSSLLKLNKGRNKSHVAIRKILEFQPNIFSDMQPFFADWILDDEQSLKALPYVIDVLNKAKAARAWSMIGQHQNIKRKKLSAIYEFARTMPLMFVTDINVTYIVQVH